MRMQKRPHKLPADVFQAELKMRMLVNRMMATEKGSSADVQPLLFGDLFGIHQARRIAGSRRGNGRVEGMRESVAEGYPRRRGLNQLRRVVAFKHARLRGHVGDVFYMAAVKGRNDRTTQ